MGLNKDCKDQTGASTLSHHKASSTMEKQRLNPTNHSSDQPLLNGCELWTLTVDLERRLQAFENKCYRRMFGILNEEHKTSGHVWHHVNILAGHHEVSLSTVQIWPSHDNLRQVIMVRPYLPSRYAAKNHTTENSI